MHNKWSVTNPDYQQVLKCEDLEQIRDYSLSSNYITCWGVIYNPLTSCELLLEMLLRVNSVSLVKYILIRLNREKMFHLLQDEHRQKLEKVKLATKDYNLFVLLEKAGVEILEADYMRGKKSSYEYRKAFINEYYPKFMNKRIEKRRTLEWVSRKTYRWIYIDYPVIVEVRGDLSNDIKSL